MQDENTNPSQDVPEDEHVPSAEVTENGAELQQSAPSLTLQEINELTGRNYKTLEEAKAGYKETYRFKTSRETSTNTPQTPEELAVLQKKIQDLEFYNENPEYKPYRDVINRFGNNPADVVNDEGFKQIFSKLKAQDEFEQSKSVLKSNPKLGIIADASKKAEESVKAANDAIARGDVLQARKAYRAAADQGVASVIEAFGLGKK